METNDTAITPHQILSARDDRPPAGVSSLRDVSQEELHHAVAAEPDRDHLHHGAKQSLGAEPGTDAYKNEALHIPTNHEIKHDHNAKSKEHAFASRDHQIMQQVEQVITPALNTYFVVWPTHFPLLQERLHDKEIGMRGKVGSAFKAMGHKIASLYHSALA